MARSIVAMAMGAGVFLVSAGAFAQEGGGPGPIHLGLRLGYGIPLGDSVGSSSTTVAGITVETEAEKLSDTYSGMIPIWLDFGYFLTPNIMLGVYGHYAIGLIADGDPATGSGCPEGADCSGSVMRFGLQGQYHLSRGQSLDPWFGLGLGYEIASATASAGGQEQTVTASGFEFANIQAGADFKVADAVAIGPFVSFSLGQYSNLSIDPEVPGRSDDIESKALHEWLTLGVKGSFGF